ncbi:hypothetical protein D3C87_1568890 [compost metagenome]
MSASAISRASDIGQMLSGFHSQALADSAIYFIQMIVRGLDAVGMLKHDVVSSRAIVSIANNSSGAGGINGITDRQFKIDT